MSAIHQALLMVSGNDGGVLPALDLGFIDGVDHVVRADDKWKNNTHATAPASGIAGMTSLCYDDSVFGQKIIVIPETGEFTATFKVRFRGMAGESFAGFANGASVHFQLEMNADGTMDVRNIGGFGTHTTSDVFVIDTTYTIEFYGLIHASAGAYRLKVDGVVPNKSGGGTMDQTGLDTQDGATSTTNRWRLGSAGTLDTYTDDHGFDVAGNDIGAGVVETLYPNGAGDLADLTRGGADSGANWSQCDEATANGVTDYVQSTGANQRDVYTFQNRSVTGTPRAVQVTTYVAAVAGSPTFRNQLRIGGVNYDGATLHTGVSGFDCYTETWNTNPATSAEWTDTDIDNLQAGILAVDTNVRMTQVVVEVWVTP